MVVASRLVAAGLAAGIAGLTFVAWRARRAGPAAQAAKQHCRTLVASKTAAKLSAVEAALSPCTVLGCSTESFVSNQPVGVEEIMRGAANRIRQLVDSDQAEQFNYAVAIENGIVRCGPAGDALTAEAWIDLAVVLVRDLATGREAVATSAGVQFPAEYVGEWIEGGSEGTVGMCIAEATGCSDQDPHHELTGGHYPRAALLEQAVRVARAQLPVLPPTVA